jgi:hypothetical protein
LATLPIALSAAVSEDLKTISPDFRDELFPTNLRALFFIISIYAGLNAMKTPWRGMGWKGVSFGPLVPLCGIAAAEKTLDSKPGRSVAYWRNEVYVTGRSRIENENLGSVR